MGEFIKTFLKDFYRHALLADYSDDRQVVSAAFEGGTSKSSPVEMRTMKKPSLWAERAWLLFTCVLFGIPMVLVPVAWSVFMHEAWYLLVLTVLFWLFCVYKFGMLSGLLRWTFKASRAKQCRR